MWDMSDFGVLLSSDVAGEGREVGPGSARESVQDLLPQWATRPEYFC